MGQRLIDVDALPEMEIERFDTTDAFEVKAKGAGRNHMRKIINDAPTVDAVPVVRCKECIEYRDSVGACHYFNYEPTDEMDFCSHGIRADGERRTECNKR
jgi:hypothetical protein